MEIYHHLIENPLFFKWIYQPTFEIDSYWKHYMESNPEEAIQILEFKSHFEKHINFKKEQLSEFEKKALAQRIIYQLEKVDKSRERQLYVRNILRYAAVGLLFFLVGSSLVYVYMEKNQTSILAEHILIDNKSVLPYLQEPILVIDNKQEIQLNHGESELDYSKTEGIVINRENVILEESDEASINTLIIPYGSRSTITLADGSKVWLNAGSRLIYPSKFTNKKREVYLVGEAFFDVERNIEKPFVVKTLDAEVKVHGTRFNVSAYPEDSNIQTVLEEGSVEVTATNFGFFGRSVALAPGQMALVNKKNEETKVYNVDVEYYTLWTEGLFSFYKIDLKIILKKLERYYGISFRYSNPKDGSIQISGKLDVTKDREEVFEYLTKLTGLKFNMINNRNYEIK